MCGNTLTSLKINYHTAFNCMCIPATIRHHQKVFYLHFLNTAKISGDEMDLTRGHIENTNTSEEI